MTDQAIKYLTVEQLSQSSGLSIRTLHRLKKKAGKLSYFQPAGKGGRLLFPTDAIEQSAQPPLDEGQPASADAPKRLSGRLPKWMQPPTQNNQE